jgi:20S proteasome subunit beta 3
MQDERPTSAHPQFPHVGRFGPWFVEPVVAGLDADGTPFITAMDLVGAEVFTTDFVVAGTCSENLYGMCESLYRPDLEPEDLFEVVSQVKMSPVCVGLK